MSKVLFFNVPAAGHTNPTLGVVRELAAAGEEVIYYSFDEFKEVIEQTGAQFRNYKVSHKEFWRANRGLTRLYRTMIEISEKMLDNHLEEVRKENPDYIIHDSTCSWAKYIAILLNIPAISSITVFAFDKKFSRVSLLALFRILVLGFWDLMIGKKAEKRLAARYNLKTNGFADAFMNTEKMNIVYISREFQPGGEEIDPSFKFVGPSITDRGAINDIVIPEPKTKPVVYISLGTVNSKNPGFYKKCFKAFAGSELFIIMSVSSMIKIDELSPIPDNFVVRNHVSQLSVLAKADVFITHGGMNSVSEGMHFGVPLIVVPQSEEQKMNAVRVADVRAGLYLRKVTPALLKEAVLAMLTDTTYRANSQIFGGYQRAAGGYKKAVQEILEFKKQNR